MEKERQVESNTGQAYATKEGIFFQEISAKNDEKKLNDLFEEIATKIIKLNDEEEQIKRQSKTKLSQKSKNIKHKDGAQVKCC